ncbi:hypothetical protein AgCh_016639 [Apium graveolens]
MANDDAEADNAELKEILKNGCWGSGLGYSTRSNSDKRSGKETERTELIKIDSKVKLNKVQIKTIKFNPSANTVKSIHEEGITSTPRSNLLTDKSEQVHTKSVNIGSMTQKQLKQMLKDLQMKYNRKRPRKNRNGKVGVNKNGNYVTPPNAPRKACSNCDSTNHLANSCRKNKEINDIPSKSEFRNRTVKYKPQSPCSHCGSVWPSIHTCKEYHSLYYDYYKLKASLIKEKSVSACLNNDSKDVNINSDKKSYVAYVNKLKEAKGSKQVRVLKNAN